MPSHNDIKTAAYLEPMLNYAETHLGIRFRRTAEYNKYSAFCPFHVQPKKRKHVTENQSSWGKY